MTYNNLKYLHVLSKHFIGHNDRTYIVTEKSLYIFHKDVHVDGEDDKTFRVYKVFC